MFSYKMDRRTTLEKEEQKKDAIEECTGQGSRSKQNRVGVFVTSKFKAVSTKGKWVVPVRK
jgi:hypothetical protein